MNPALRIVVVAPDLAVSDPGDEYALNQAERSRSLRIGLLEGGFNLVAVLPADAFLPERLRQLQPDMIIVDAESEARDALEHVVMATRDERRPIVMFTNDDDTSHVRDAVAAGVSAYIVAGLSSERIRPILDVAMARFQHEQALREELASTKTELHDRKLIDRAKGLLMQRQGLSEQGSGDWNQFQYRTQDVARTAVHGCEVDGIHAEHDRQHPEPRDVIGLVGDLVERIADTRALYVWCRAFLDQCGRGALDDLALLYRVREFVRDELLARVRVGLELVAAEVDVVADRERAGLQLCPFLGGALIGVDTHTAKVRTEAWFHERADR